MLVLATAFAACGDGNTKSVSGPSPTVRDGIDLASSAFDQNRAIPEQFTCDGDNLPPPFEWSGVPREAESLALTLEDRDGPGGTLIHWTLFEIDPVTDSLAPGEIPEGAVQGKNSFGKSGYVGPCPPEGDSRHRYVFKLYALKRPLTLGRAAAPSDVLAGIDETAIVGGELTATYARR